MDAPRSTDQVVFACRAVIMTSRAAMMVPAYALTT
jgi:hypothetical protein